MSRYLAASFLLFTVFGLADYLRGDLTTTSTFLATRLRAGEAIANRRKSQGMRISSVGYTSLLPAFYGGAPAPKDSPAFKGRNQVRFRPRLQLCFINLALNEKDTPCISCKRLIRNDWLMSPRRTATRPGWAIQLSGTFAKGDRHVIQPVTRPRLLHDAESDRMQRRTSIVLPPPPEA